MDREHLNLKYIAAKLKEEEHPVRFLLSKILWKKNSRLCKLFTVPLSHGVKIRLYPTSSSFALWLNPHQFDSAGGPNFIWNYLSDGDIFVDVGANIGHLTLTAAKKVGRGQVISIEPHPEIFKYLNNNINLNKLTNVKTYNLAVGEKTGQSQFSDMKTDDQNFVTEHGPVNVSITKLDDLVSGKVHLLKIDVEGYELFVLKGAVNTLSRTEAVYIESWDTNFKKYNYATGDIVHFLEHNNFKVFRFITDDKLQQVDRNYISEKCENVLAIKDINSFQDKFQNIILNAKTN
jgi:FkbM family methyltransferase